MVNTPAKDKKRYEAHKKEIAETTRKYREANKERIRLKDKERKSEKVVCDICGKMMSKGNISSHKKNQHPIIDENKYPS